MKFQLELFATITVAPVAPLCGLCAASPGEVLATVGMAENPLTGTPVPMRRKVCKPCFESLGGGK